MIQSVDDKIEKLRDELGEQLREARALASLDHPYIVPVYSFERDQGLHFLTMAYIIFVNPALLSQTGMDFGAVLVANRPSA